MRLFLLGISLATGIVNAAQLEERSSGANKHESVVAHGVLMSLAFLIFFPFGALTVRVLSFNHMVWVHAGTQVVALAIATAGVGLGIWIAITTQQLDMVHPIIGLVVFALLVLFQPIGGLLHHLIIRKSVERSQTFIGESHKWLGRVLILLGAINGGLGLQLSANTTGGEIAYGVVAGVVFIIYVIVDVVTINKDKRTNKGEKGEKMISPSTGMRSPTTNGSIDGSAMHV
ncbi:MAG: hypothetical protein MMC33_008083 [Icmadophila ericetorum]|nr:hypothetical protein [Icmadophila ericetorum]